MEFERPQLSSNDYIRAFANSERRFMSEGLEIRMHPDTKKKVYRGYGAKFNTLSEDFGGWREKIAPGFFNQVLGNDVRILRDHTPSMILGRTTAGTGRIGVDDIGLWYEYDESENTYSLDLARSIERKDITGSSFSFTLDYGSALSEKWEKQKDNTWVRTLLVAKDLHDTGPVTFPAYRDTSVAERSFKKLLIPEGIDHAADLLEMDRDLMLRDLPLVKKAS